MFSAEECLYKMGMDPIEKNQSCELLIDENPLLSKSELNLT